MTPEDFVSLSHAFDLFYWAGVITGITVALTGYGAWQLVQAARRSTPHDRRSS